MRIILFWSFLGYSVSPFIIKYCKILVNKELEKYYLDFIENMMRISKNYQKDILEKNNKKDVNYI